MLPAAARMRRSAEFSSAVRGARAAAPSLVLHARTGGSDQARVGFVVGRAVGSAVVRNRVRRRLRHLVAARLDRLPPGAHVVVRATPAAASHSFAELGDDLDRVLGPALDRAARRDAVAEHPA